MLTLELNWLAVIAAAAAHVVIGFAWYQPWAFGRTWAGLAGRPLAGGGPAYGVSILAALVTATVLGLLVRATGAAVLAEGALVGGLAWLGFVATSALVDHLFAGRPIRLWLIQAGYQLVGLVAMGAILGQLV
jgi:hypothetical protein